MAELYAPDATISNPLVRIEHQGPEGARRFWSPYRAAFGSIRSEFHHVFEEDGAALLKWTSTGAGPDSMIRYRGVSVLEFEGGKLTAFRTYFDPRHLGEQLVDHPKADSSAEPSGG